MLRFSIPPAVRLAFAGLLFALTVLSVGLDVTAILALPNPLLLLVALLLGGVAVGSVVWGQHREIQALRESLHGRDSQRRVAIGRAITQAQRLDKEIMALKGEARNQPGPYADRLNQFHAAALTVVREFAPEREGYYLSDAGLPMSIGIVTGWRDTYVAELRRRIMRLNDLQRE